MAPRPCPVPMPTESSGSKCRALIAGRWAGSSPKDPATHHAAAPGAKICAHRAAAATPNPSMSTGVRRTADCAKMPVKTARSGEPMRRRTRWASARSSRTRYIASRIAPVFTRHAESPITEPQPTALTGSIPQMEPITAAATVVRPRPKSPRRSSWVPLSASASAIAMPCRRCSPSSASDIASSTSIEPEGRALVASTKETKMPAALAAEINGARPSMIADIASAVKDDGNAEISGWRCAMPCSPATTISLTSWSWRGGS